MTVQELINKLQTIRDRSLPVVLVEWNIQNPLSTKHEVETNRIVVQPHRVAIIVD